jgi:hypothetical protein
MKQRTLIPSTEKAIIATTTIRKENFGCNFHRLIVAFRKFLRCFISVIYKLSTGRDGIKIWFSYTPCKTK